MTNKEMVNRFMKELQPLTEWERRRVASGMRFFLYWVKLQKRIGRTEELQKAFMNHQNIL